MVLYIGNLPADCSREELHAYLSQFDQVVWMKISRDSKSSPGYCYAHAILKSPDGYERMLGCPAHAVRRKKIRVKMDGHTHVHSKHEHEANKRKVFVKRLSKYMSCDKLKDHFSQFGTVEDVGIPVNRENNTSKRIAFVTFKQEEDAEKCAKLKKQMINGVEVICTKFKPPADPITNAEPSVKTLPSREVAANHLDSLLDKLKSPSKRIVESVRGGSEHSTIPLLPMSRDSESLGLPGVEKVNVWQLHILGPKPLSTAGRKIGSMLKTGPQADFSMDETFQNSVGMYNGNLHSLNTNETISPNLRFCEGAGTSSPKFEQDPVDTPVGTTSGPNHHSQYPQKKGTAIVFFKATGFRRI
jgi:RNA recognition motif-containing protein